MSKLDQEERENLLGRLERLRIAGDGDAEKTASLDETASATPENAGVEKTASADEETDQLLAELDGLLKQAESEDDDESDSDSDGPPENVKEKDDSGDGDLSDVPPALREQAKKRKEEGSSGDGDSDEGDSEKEASAADAPERPDEMGSIASLIEDDIFDKIATSIAAEGQDNLAVKLASRRKRLQERSQKPAKEASASDEGNRFLEDLLS